MSDTTTHEYVVMFAIVAISVLIGIGWPLLAPLMPGVRHYHVTMETRWRHEWAVVVSSSSPPRNVRSLHSLKWSARWAAFGRDRCVMSVVEAITKDTSRYAPRFHKVVELPDFTKKKV